MKEKFLLYKRDLLFIGILVCVVLVLTLPTITKYPIPGGDEPGFVDAAATLATQGRLNTNLYLGILPGMDQHVYWQPPIYFLALGIWFRLFGIGLFQARLFSLLCGFAVLIGLYRLCRFWTSPLTAFLATGLCGISYWFLRSSCLARMDMLCVALLFCATLAYKKAESLQSKQQYALTGFISGLAFLTHPLGIVALGAIMTVMTLQYRKNILRVNTIHALLGGFLACALAWGIYIMQDPTAFLQQMQAQWGRKQTLVHLGVNAPRFTPQVVCPDRSI